MPAMAQIPDGLQIYGRVNVTAERISDNRRTARSAEPVELRVRRQLVAHRLSLQQGAGARHQARSSRSRAASSSTDGRQHLQPAATAIAGFQGDSYGTIRLGRTIGPVYYATYDYISMHNHDTGTSSDALLAGTVVGNQGFMNNTLWYTSPKFGGFTVDFAFSLLGERRIDQSVEQPRHVGLVGAYDAGPVAPGAVVREHQERLRRLDPAAESSQASTPRLSPSAARMTSSSWCWGRCMKPRAGHLWRQRRQRLLARRAHVPVRTSTSCT
jgi:hypothetical protein